MKKTTNITIGNRLFTIDDDAYQALQSYLSKLQGHFAGSEDAEEIMADIEAAIADHFADMVKADSESITLQHVTDITRMLGEAHDLAEEDGVQEQAVPNNDAPKSAKRLYRDGETAQLAGVCAGMAAYFGIDPVIVRVAFIIATLFGGWGIIAYLIFWVVTPEAKTTADKLQMRGEPLTLQTIEDMAKKTAQAATTVGQKAKEAFSNAETTNNHVVQSGLQRVTGFIGQTVGYIISFIGKIFSVIAPIIRIVVGIALLAISIFGMVALGVFIFGFFLSTERYQLAFTMTELLGNIDPLIAAISIYGVFFIPLLALLFGDIALIFKRKVFSLGLASVMLLAWIAAVTATGVIGFSIAPNIQAIEHRISTAPQVSRTFDVDDFTKIDIGGPYTLKVTKGNTTTVEASAAEHVINHVDAVVNRDTLTFNHERVCLFCEEMPMDIVVTVPNLQSLDLSGSISTMIDEMDADVITLDLSGYSSVRLESISTTKLLADTSGRSAITIDGGIIEQATYDLSGASEVDTENVLHQMAYVDLSGVSSLITQVTDRVRGDLSGASSLMLVTEPTQQQLDISGSAEVIEAIMNEAPVVVTSTSSTVE